MVTYLTLKKSRYIDNNDGTMSLVTFVAVNHSLLQYVFNWSNGERHRLIDPNVVFVDYSMGIFVSPAKSLQEPQDESCLIIVATIS